MTPEVELKFVDDALADAAGGRGLPGYRLEAEHGQPWRSRYDSGRNEIVIISAHRDFLASRSAASSGSDASVRVSSEPDSDERPLSVASHRRVHGADGTIVSFSSGGIVIVAFFRSAARAGAETRSRNGMYTGAGVLANASATRTASGPSSVLSPRR